MEHQYAELKLPRLSGVTTAVYDLLDKDSASIYIGPPYGMHSVRGMHITRPDLAGRILQFNSMPYSMLAHSKSSAYTMCVLQQQSPIVIVESWDAKNDKHAEYLSRIVEILKPRGIVNLSSGHY